MWGTRYGRDKQPQKDPTMSQNNAPASAAPTDKSPISVVDILTLEHSVETLVSFGRGPLATVSKQLWEREKSLNGERLKNAKEYVGKIRDGHKPFGKVLIALRRTFDAALAANEIAQGTTYSVWMKDNVGKTLDELGRGAACASVFTNLVETGLLPESDYDHSTTEWLTDCVSPIITALKKRDGDKWTSAVELIADKTGVIYLLKVRKQDTHKFLKAIKAALTGKTRVDGGTLDAPMADKLLRTIAENEFNKVTGIEFTVNTLIDVISKIPVNQRNPDWLKAAGKLVTELETVPQNAQSTPPPATDTPAPQAPATAPVETPAPAVSGPNAAEWVAANYGNDITEADRPYFVEGAEQFIETNHRLPADRTELDAAMEAATA